MRKGPIGSRMIVEFRKIGSVSIISFLVFLFTKKSILNEKQNISGVSQQNLKITNSLHLRSIYCLRHTNDTGV